MCFIFLSFFSFTLSVVDKCSAHNSQHIIYHNHKRLLLMMCLCGSLCVVCGLVSESDISFALFMLLDILVTVVVVVAACCWLALLLLLFFIFRWAIRTKHSNETNSIEILTGIWHKSLIQLIHFEHIRCCVYNIDLGPQLSVSV